MGCHQGANRKGTIMTTDAQWKMDIADGLEWERAINATRIGVAGVSSVVENLHIAD
jgi:hypothetical protein